MSAESEMVYVKKLSLVTPDYARWIGLRITEPVFIDLSDRLPFTYEAGAAIAEEGYFDPLDTGTVRKVSVLDNVAFVRNNPRVGISYTSMSSDLLSKERWNWRDIRSSGWVALLEPLGGVIRHQDYFFAFNSIATGVKITEIRAFCGGCSDGPLAEGEVLEPYQNGFLFPICNSDIHIKHRAENPEAHQVKYYFQINDRGEVAISKV